MAYSNLRSIKKITKHSNIEKVSPWFIRQKSIACTLYTHLDIRQNFYGNVLAFFPFEFKKKNVVYLRQCKATSSFTVALCYVLKCCKQELDNISIIKKIIDFSIPSVVCESFDTSILWFNLNWSKQFNNCFYF